MAYLDPQKLQQFRDAAIKGGYDPKVVDGFVQKKYAEGIAQGGVPLTEIQEDPTLRQIQYGQVSGGQYKSPPTAEEKKEVAKLDTVKANVNVLEKNLSESELRGPVAARMLWLSNITGGAVAPQARDYEALRKSLIGPMARIISGEVGVLTDRDIKRAEELLPNLTDTDEVAKNKLGNIRSLISEREGKAPQETKSDLSAGSKSVATMIPSALLEILGGSTKKYFGQTVPEYYQKGYQGYGEQLKESAKLALPAASSAAEIGAIAGAGKAIKGGAKFLTGGGPKAAIGKARTVALEKSTATFSGDKLAKVVQDAKKINPEIKKVADVWVKDLKGKTLSATQLADKIKVWNNAYTAAGRVGKAGRAGLFDVLAKAAKSELKEKAPEVAKYTSQLNFLYKAPKVTRDVVWKALQISGLAKLLGL